MLTCKHGTIWECDNRVTIKYTLIASNKAACDIIALKLCSECHILVDSAIRLYIPTCKRVARIWHNTRYEHGVDTQTLIYLDRALAIEHTTLFCHKRHVCTLHNDLLLNIYRIILRHEGKGTCHLHTYRVWLPALEGIATIWRNLWNVYKRESRAIGAAYDARESILKRTMLAHHELNLVAALNLKVVHNGALDNMLIGIGHHAPRHQNNLIVIAEHEVLVDEAQGTSEDLLILSRELLTYLLVDLNRLLLYSVVAHSLRVGEFVILAWRTMPLAHIPQYLVLIRIDGVSEEVSVLGSYMSLYYSVDTIESLI